MSRALLGMGMGMVLSRVGLAGTEGVIRGMDGQEPWLIFLGVLAIVVHRYRRKTLIYGWRRQVGVGALLGVGVGLLGALPITLAASLGEGRLLALPLMAVCFAGWHFAGRWELSEKAPAARPVPERSADVHLDSGTDSAE